MSLPFTGERVVPGEVEPGLWREHLARYAFAARFCAGKGVLDLGCGAGYGANLLARFALSVTALDRSREALAYARRSFDLGNIGWIEAHGALLPFEGESFDVVVALELLEHVPDWRNLLSESRRVLAPEGTLIVSTPNRLFQQQSRRLAGPNSFHEHEFEFEELRDELRVYFRFVRILLQNSAPSEAILEPGARAADAQIAGAGVAPRESKFFVARCSNASLPEDSPFLYVGLEESLSQEQADPAISARDRLAAARCEHHRLLAEFRKGGMTETERQVWAEQLSAYFAMTGDFIEALLRKTGE